MGKGKKKGNSEAKASPQEPPQEVTISLREFLARDPRGFNWVVGCLLLGIFLGFIAGTGWLESSTSVKPWRVTFGKRVRASATYQLLTLDDKVLSDMRQSLSDWAMNLEREYEIDRYAKNPAHSRVFAVLREAIIREKGGFVHQDLGFLSPAPCGAARGIGMVREAYDDCQRKCLPGLANEKQRVKQERASFELQNLSYPIPEDSIFHQEEVLIKVPLSFQMTRSVALQTLLPLIPDDVQRSKGILELDDAALLAVLIAHEKGVGRYSKWVAYLATLPKEPSCGYSRRLRPFMLDAMAAYRDELGVQTHGWAEELLRATKHADNIVIALNASFGEYIETPADTTSEETIRWALCHVASRATAGSEKHGHLRMIPLLDLINHDEHAGMFEELTGEEQMDHGSFIDAVENDSGAFVVRSMRYGRLKPLSMYQELMINYNAPSYTPLDWFVTSGFVPPEKRTPWRRMDPIPQSQMYSTPKPQVFPNGGDREL